MEALVADAQSKGARVLAGGSRIGNRGYFFPHTVLADVPDDARAMNEEPFGPLALVNPVRNLDEAIEKANSLPFGLAACAFARSAHNADHLANEVEVGNLSINHFVASVAETPFGALAGVALCVSEEIGAFVGFELLQRIGGGSFEYIEGSRSGLAHMRLKLCEGVFDRIEVRTVGRQIAEFSAAGFNSLSDTCDFVGGQIVHDDDGVGAQRWRQHLLDPGQKGLSVHRSLEKHRRNEACKRLLQPPVGANPCCTACPSPSSRLNRKDGPAIILG